MPQDQLRALKCVRCGVVNERHHQTARGIGIAFWLERSEQGTMKKAGLCFGSPVVEGKG
jgi:hypothetical protein